MIANMTSYALARRFRHTPIYEALLVQDDIFLPHPSRSTAHALERLQVSQAMNTDPVVLRPDMTVREAAEFVQRYEFTTFPIVDAESNCAGFITEMRLRRNLVEKQAERPIVEIADECRSVQSDEPLANAVLLMHETRVRQLAVTDHATAAKLVGIITMSDIVRVQAETMKSSHASK
jgi:CBS domain-containing protein